MYQLTSNAILEQSPADNSSPFSSITCASNAISAVSCSVQWLTPIVLDLGIEGAKFQCSSFAGEACSSPGRDISRFLFPCLS